MTKILVTGDHQNIRVSLELALFEAGYEVIQAKNGEEALEQVCREHPDLIILDVDLPVMDGFEVMRRLQEDPATSGVPIIIPLNDSTYGSRLGAPHDSAASTGPNQDWQG